MIRRYDVRQEAEEQTTAESEQEEKIKEEYFQSVDFEEKLTDTLKHL